VNHRHRKLRREAARRARPGLRRIGASDSEARRDRRGGALAASLVVVMLMAMLSAAMLTLRGSMARRQLGALDAKRVFYVAEAGLAEGAASLALGKNGNVGSSADPARFGEGIFWTEALSPADGYTQLTCTALCGTGRCTLQMVVHNGPDLIGSLGLFGDQSVAIGKSSSVVGFDSSRDAGVVPVSVPAHVASNGAIDIAAGTRALPTTIRGDVVPGPGQAVTAGLNTSITGSTAPGEAAAELPLIAVPDLPSIGSFQAKGGGTKTLPTHAGAYTSITVKSGTVLSISGPATIHASSLDVQAGGTLQLQTELGSIELYIDNALEFAAGSSISCPTQEAKSLTIYHLGDPNASGQTPKLTLDATGALYAKVYAPLMPITLPSTLQAYGAVVGKSVSLGTGAHFSYDVATAQSPAADAGGAMPSPIAWRLLELPESVGSLERVDPIKALGLDAAVLRKPADATSDTDYLVKFEGLDGKHYTYVGSEAEFDASKVANVIYIRTPDDDDFAKKVRKSMGRDD
jgi:hypothetical protein